MEIPVVPFPSSVIINRISGLLISGPSIMTTLKTITVILPRYSGKLRESILIAGCVLGIITDIIIMSSVFTWLTDGRWSGWGYIVTIVAGFERLRSIQITQLCLTRMFALVLPLQRYKELTKYLTIIYGILGIICIILEVYVYSSSHWDAMEFSHHPSYGIKRGARVLCVLFYLIPAICTDLYLLTSKKVNSLVSERITKVRTFYNIHLFTCLELLISFCVMIPLLIGLADLNNDWSSPIFTEQLLLSIITLNTVISIKAAIGEGGVFQDGVSPMPVTKSSEREDPQFSTGMTGKMRRTTSRSQDPK